MKAGVRYMAVASGPIKGKKRTLLVGVVLRNNYIEGLLSSSIEVDGTDSTRRIIGMIGKSRFGEQIRILVLNGIALAGLNVVDPKVLEKRLGVKVVLLNRRRQDAEELAKALVRFSRTKGKRVDERLEITERHSKIRPLAVRGMFIQSGLEPHFVRKFADNAFESIRVAHIIARGIASGESRGRI